MIFCLFLIVQIRPQKVISCCWLPIYSREDVEKCLSTGESLSDDSLCFYWSDLQKPLPCGTLKWRVDEGECGGKKENCGSNMLTCLTRGCLRLLYFCSLAHILWGEDAQRLSILTTLQSQYFIYVMWFLSSFHRCSDSWWDTGALTPASSWRDVSKNLSNK